jgi:hypothetical protein
MPIVLVLVGLVVVALLNVAADRLRDRVDVVRSATSLMVRSQQAAVRLDASILMLCLVGAAYAAATRSLLLAGLALAAAGLFGWRIYRARRTPVIVFDQQADAVWRGDNLLCSLSAIDSFRVSAAQDRATLGMTYHTPSGEQREWPLYRARPGQVVAVHRAISEFLGRPTP